MVAVRELGLMANATKTSEALLLHGQKMADIVRVFQSVKAAEPFAKAIFFCQWSGLESCLARALDDAGVAYCRLSSCTDIFQRTEMIESFQRARSETQAGSWRRLQSAAEADVMLLNYEHSASGAHLTVANHVFIVHPLVASTPTLSRAYERQAIGRVVRLGQSKDVTVHRFIAANTVESALMDRIGRA
jgi:SWI/SNF-related matrix-associated actin-dependent regulator of chromatin subfamily A3